MEKLKSILSKFLSHPEWTAVGVIVAIIGVIVAIIGVIVPFLFQHDSSVKISPSSGQIDPKDSSCIKNSIQAMPHNEVPNLPKSLNYLSGCYVDGCYTYQLKITDIVETDISNQYLKGLDWHVGLSVSGNKVGGPIHVTVIKIRSNGKNIDEIKRKNALNLDDKVYVWLDSLGICNRGKYK